MLSQVVLLSAEAMILGGEQLAARLVYSNKGLRS